MFKSLRAKPRPPSEAPVLGALVAATGPILESKGVAKVVFTLQENAREDPVQLSRIQHALVQIARDGPGNSNEEYVHNLLNTPLQYDTERRLRLPSSVTLGIACYLMETLLDFQELPDPFWPEDLNHGLVPGRAQPGDTGEFVIQAYDEEGIEARRQARIAAVAARGRKVPAVLVQANAELYAPGERDLPALALFTFRKDLPDRTRRLLQLAAFLGELKEREPASPAEERAAAMMAANENGWRYHRRWTLPPELTEDVPFHLGDLWVARSYLKSAYLTDADVAVPCVAEDGDQGGIEMLHHSVVSKRG